MATPKNQPAKYDEVYDLVIIGAGGHAAEAGKKVLIIEKMGFPGGSSAISGGQWPLMAPPIRKNATSKTTKNGLSKI